MKLRLPTILGLISALIAFCLLQIGFYHRPWGQPIGFLVMILGLLAIILGFWGWVAALISKTGRVSNTLLFLSDIFLGVLFGLWGFYLLIPD